MIELERISDSEAKAVYKDISGVVRYSARFHIQTSGKLKVSNKLFHDENGMSVKHNASIPDSIFNQMRRGAYWVLSR